jgi:hypothetical protein
MPDFIMFFSEEVVTKVVTKSEEVVTRRRPRSAASSRKNPGAGLVTTRGLFVTTFVTTSSEKNIMKSGM